MRRHEHRDPGEEPSDVGAAPPLPRDSAARSAVRLDPASPGNRYAEHTARCTAICVAPDGARGVDEPDHHPGLAVRARRGLLRRAPASRAVGVSVRKLEAVGIARGVQAPARGRPRGVLPHLLGMLPARRRRRDRGRARADAGASGRRGGARRGVPLRPARRTRPRSRGRSRRPARRRCSRRSCGRRRARSACGSRSSR